MQDLTPPGHVSPLTEGMGLRVRLPLRGRVNAQLQGLSQRHDGR
jgi:hypothetical protein